VARHSCRFRLILPVIVALVALGPASLDALDSPSGVSGLASAVVYGSDAESAATTARDLSRLEAEGDFNSLYDRIHPDAHAQVPRAAVVGWFQTVWAPMGPGVATVTGVRFVEWTWAVTGETYPYTAEVSFTQPFADGSVTDDVVRLVQDAKGDWRWFFGRDRAFVDEQIARYVEVATSASATTLPELVVTDLDAFWIAAFSTGGRTYRSPVITPVFGTITTPCGRMDASASPGAYCPANATIYYSEEWYDGLVGEGVDFAWVTVIAHEWGHHVQARSGVRKSAAPDDGDEFYSIDIELQADCLAGAYALDAQSRGLLDVGDLTEAVMMSASGGDSPLIAPDHPGAHGTNDQRITSFMRGYLDGFGGCGIEL